MKIVGLVGIILLAILFVIDIITVGVGDCNIGYGGYPDEWRSEKCRKLHIIISIAELIIISILFTLTIIIAAMH